MGICTANILSTRPTRSRSAWPSAGAGPQRGRATTPSGGGLISFVLFRAGLWYITHAKELGGAFTTNFWMLINTMLVGLFWASFALIAVVGLFLPSVRRKMIIPLLVHVIFALGSIEPIAHFMEMFWSNYSNCR